MMCARNCTAVGSCRFEAVLLFVVVLTMLGWCFEIFSWLDRHIEHTSEHHIFQSTLEAQ